jgi:hypothetical protein
VPPFRGCGNKFVGKDELSIGYVAYRHIHFTIVPVDAHVITFLGNDSATNPATAIDPSRQFNFGHMASKSAEIRHSNQWAVNSRRANFKLIGAMDWVGDIEQGGDDSANLGTIINCHRPPITSLGHGLKSTFATP